MISVRLAKSLDLKVITPERIRNFGIIAHIDHGKSTLADRLLELTGCMQQRTGSPSLDFLPVERERGITVKAQTATMFYGSKEGGPFLLNLIDTPGHADFTNEVSRSLAAMQGAVLVVDAVAGVQAQTVAHYWRAKDHGIQKFLPVINKVDLPQADPDRVLEQLEDQLGLDVFNCPVLNISAKTGLNIDKVIPAIIEWSPSAGENSSLNGPFEAGLVDCWYQEFRGVICLINVRKGILRIGDYIKSLTTEKEFLIEEIGILQPELIKTDYLHSGQMGYIRCGIKSTDEAIIGDTFYAKDSDKPMGVALPKRMRPIVFAGMFPAIRDAYDQVMIAIEKLLLNDSSVSVEKIVSSALGPGWRLGFLGSLHMDVFRQRLEQEFNVSVILTSPNVSYEVIFKQEAEYKLINSSEEYPDQSELGNVREFREPFVKGTIIFPASFIGSVSSLCSEHRCGESSIEYPSTDRVKMIVQLPLVEIIGDFHDRLLSISAGYASFDYEPSASQPVELVKIGIKLNGDLIDILSTIQPKVRSESIGRKWTRRLTEILPRQQFPVAVQAVIGNKIISRDNIAAMRKDVIAKCYGGDKTRKMKLLQAQKEGKERMRMFGKVEIPHNTFVEIMKISKNVNS